MSPQTAREELIEAILLSAFTDRMMIDRFDERAAALLGINVTDNRALGVLELRGRSTASTLGAELRTSNAAVTRIVDRLERAGYVRRTRSILDRRQVLIEPTELARTRREAVYGVGDEATPGFVGWTEDELRAALRFERLSIEWFERRLALLAGRPPLTPDTDGTARPAP